MVGFPSVTFLGKENWQSSCVLDLDFNDCNGQLIVHEESRDGTHAIIFALGFSPGGYM